MDENPHMETPAATRYRQQISDCPAPTGDWGRVPSPIGPIEVPGFDEWRDLTDEELCEKMNTAPHVSPAGLAVATRRLSVTHYHNGKAWVWDTLANWKAQRGY